jgi:hypothetical protein
MRLHFRPDAQIPPAVRDCEADVFLRWYGNTREYLAEAYGPYEAQQTSFLWLTVGDEVVGSLRLIRPGALPLRTVQDIEGPPWDVDADAEAAKVGMDLSRTWDIATVAVRPEILGAAGTSVAAQILYHAAGEAAMANGASWMVAIADRRVRVLASNTGLTMRQIPGTGAAEYMGSPTSLPVYAHIETVFAEQRAQDPESYRRGTTGTGAEHLFDEIVLPERHEYVLPPTSVDLTEVEPSLPTPRSES